ncbi:unnamed protein product, partial [marine sediment metagenome]
MFSRRKKGEQARKIKFNDKIVELIVLDGLIEEICGGIKSYNDREYISNIHGNMGYKKTNPNLIIRRPLTEEEKRSGIKVKDFSIEPHLIRYDKGGATIRSDGALIQYYKPIEFYIKWDTNTVSEIDRRHGLRNRHRYFSEGIGVSTVGEYSPIFRYSNFDVFFNNYNIIFAKNAY